MIGIFHGRGIAEAARVHVQIDVDLRNHLHVFSNGRNSNALSVFLCIALHGDSGGWAWPSRDLLHDRTGIGTGQAMSNALAHLRRATIGGQRIFAHYRVRDPETRTWGGSAYLLFPDLEHPDPPWPDMEEWDPEPKEKQPHVGNQHLGHQDTGNPDQEVKPFEVDPLEVKDCAAKTAAHDPDSDAAFLAETRIEGESTIDQMTAAEKAKVASPIEGDEPPEVAAPRWETMMRKSLAKTSLPGDFQIADVVGVCKRFTDITSNPVPASPKGNLNWRAGAARIIEDFHGSLFTLYERNGATMPDLETQRRLLTLCIDLFFVPGSGYHYIRAPTPRALASSMPSLIGDIGQIRQLYGLTGTLPDRTHIEGWIVQKEKDNDKAKKGRQGPQRAPTVDETIRAGGGGADQRAKTDAAAAERIVKARAAAG